MRRVSENRSITLPTSGSRASSIRPDAPPARSSDTRSSIALESASNGERKAIVERVGLAVGGDRVAQEQCVVEPVQRTGGTGEDH